MLSKTFPPTDHIWTNTKVFCMQKNEGIKLKLWLDYYGNLFGYQNLIVLDNDSTDSYTQELLTIAETFKNVTVNREYKTYHDFRNKGATIAYLAHKIMKEDPSIQFILPVDCDEHLAVVTDTHISTNPLDIHAELYRHLTSKKALQINMSMMNVVRAVNTFCPDVHFKKSMLPAGPIQSIDEGFHVCTSAMDPDGVKTTRLTYLHYHHDESYTSTKRKALVKLGPNFKGGTREEISHELRPGQAGGHLKDIVLMTESDYYKRYDDRLRIIVEMPFRYMQPGSQKPIAWYPNRYIKFNPDVLGWAHGPLHHYLMHGHRENRKL